MRSGSYREGGDATTLERVGWLIRQTNGREDADVTRSRESRDVSFPMCER